ncbi:MAG: sterol desaturase family protein [Chitinophagales bacterium]|nr:sterol desaturase family protein [Chitinophagales bacterium]
MKKVFQYCIYPVIMLSASFILIFGMKNGYNMYLVSLPVITLSGVLILFLERWMPYEKDWIKGKGDWNLDLTYYIINYCIKLTAQYLLILLAQSISFFNWFPKEQPFWLQVILALTIIDFFLFFVHLQSHKYKFLWNLHAIHHSSERLYFLNGDKRHALHQLIEGGPGIIVCMVIGTPPVVIITALALLAVNMFMQHTNLDYKAGILKKFFCVAELHRWHHRADFKDAQVNYGAWLTVWDYIFKTAYDKPKMLTKLGEIGIAEERNFPKNYWKQFLYPFSKKVQQQSKTTLLMLAFVLAGTLSFAQTTADDITGNWQLQDGSKRIHVFKENGKYHGKIYWVKEPAKQSEIGKKVLWNLVFDMDDKEWNGGEIQLPDMSHSASCYIKLKNANTASVTGYHGMKLFGKTKTLLRIN